MTPYRSLTSRNPARVAEAAGLRAGYVAIVQLGRLPKTSSGKVQRRKTRAQFEAGDLEEHGQPAAALA